MKILLKKYLIKTVFSLLIICSTSLITVAQCPDENNPDCPGGGENPGGGGPGVPLDGGVSLLIAGGVSYVAVKIRKQQLRKKKTEHLEPEK